MSAFKLAIGRLPMLLALDFDKTLTATDTLSAVTSVAKRKYPNNRSFAWFADRYMEDYDAHKAQWSSIIHKHTDARSMTRDLMSRYLESFRQVENASLGRVSKYGIIAGVSHAELFDGGRKVQFRPGAADVINHFLRVPNCHVCVVSANWSADFIRGALDANGVSGQTSVAIHCNDLDFSSNTGLSLATVRPRLVVASDKVARVAGYKDELTHKYGSDIALVYAGDSLTDLPALLLADVGLCVGQGGDVVKWCKLLDIEFDKPRFGENNKALYRLSDWRSAIDIVESHFK